MGKRYKDALKTFDRQKYYPMDEALKLVQDNAKAKFDETIEVHFRLGIDPRHSDQQLRTTVMLPNGTGKTIRILAFVDEQHEEAALAAGADIIGSEEVINKIRNDGWLDFDAAIATPPMMRKVGQVARILGPRGLMPNPKAGTVVPPDDIPRVINELKAGRVEFRNDRTGNVHVPVGKASFSYEHLSENLQAVVDTIKAIKPESQKGIYVRRMTLTSAMGPGVRVDGMS
jgi:large subunit ribosomal protein L1